MPSNEKIYDIAQDALQSRVNWEKKLARFELQRFCQDRQRIQNSPWPKSSNIRYPLSDMVISQWKPFLYKTIFSSEQLAHFRGLTSNSARFNAHTSSYFDYVKKQMTRYETEIMLCADSWLQDGETIMKCLWDDDSQAPYSMQVDNLFVITPSTTSLLDEAPWVIHVIHASPNSVLKRFKDVDGIEEFLAKAEESDARGEVQSIDREEDRYTRTGINRQTKTGQLILWELHYKDEDTGDMRLKTLTPQDLTLDFKDDRDYPYEWCKKHKKWMLRHSRREWVSRDMHSSRGIPELCFEGEHSLSALWRSFHNALAFHIYPAFSAPQGITGSTQNIAFLPGQIFPFDLQKIDLGNPPFEILQEMQNIRSIYERYLATPDFGIDKGNGNNDSRTATEVQHIGNLQSVTVDLIAGLWKAFNGDIFRMEWGLMVEKLKDNKNASLRYFLDNEGTEIPIEAIMDEYQIDVAGSSEAVNKEYMVQKATAMWNMALQLGDPQVVYETWKNVVERLEPGQVERFSPEPQVRQQKAVQKAAVDMSVIMSTSFPMVAEPGDDCYTQAVTAMQFLQSLQQLGKPVAPDQLKRITDYIASNRAALKQTNKNQYNQLNQALNQLDMQAKQQQMAAAGIQMPQGMPPQGAPASPAPMPQLPQQAQPQGIMP